MEGISRDRPSRGSLSGSRCFDRDERGERPFSNVAMVHAEDAGYAGGSASGGSRAQLYSSRGDRRIANFRPLGQRSPPSWPRLHDEICQTRTRNAAGADATASPPPAGASDHASVAADRTSTEKSPFSNRTSTRYLPRGRLGGGATSRLSGSSSRSGA